MPDLVPDGPGRRLSLAIWTAWEHPVSFSTEGVTRLLAFLIQGAAESGRVTFHLCVRPVNAAAARAMLEGLRACEGQDWVLHTIEGPGGGAAARGTSLSYASGTSPGSTAKLLAQPDARIARMLFVAGLASTPFFLLRAAFRPLWRLAWRHGLRLSFQARRDPVGAAPEIALGIRRLRLPVFRRWAADLEAWAKARRAEQASVTEPVPAARRMPDAAEPRPEAPPEPNWRVPTLGQQPDAWLSLMADFVVPANLKGRRAMVLPDAIMLEFGSGFPTSALGPDGAVSRWLSGVRRNLNRCETVITYSTHVAARHAVGLLGADPRKIRVVPHAAPDLRTAAPFLPADRRRTAASRAEAANILRHHAAERRWRYLADFPLEHVDYIAVSTQERPSKNLTTVVEALRILVQERHGHLKLLMTTPFVSDPDDPTLKVADKVRREGLMLDVLSLPHLPDREHAALYHAAALTVHPAFFEGGDAPFPFSESVSVGTPCLMARGPHTEELLRQHPDLEPFLFDPYDPEILADMITAAIGSREQTLDVQLAAYGRMQERRWSQVAEEYATAATGLSLVPVRELQEADLVKARRAG